MDEKVILRLFLIFVITRDGGMEKLTYTAILLGLL